MTTQLTPTTLWPRVHEQFHKADASGALVPLNTDVRSVSDGGLTFAVRVARGLMRKPEAGTTPPSADPFKPPFEPDLYVGPVGDTHEALLNKFNVLDNHLLLVTRRDAPQTERLDEADCRALLQALAGVDGLAFYNGGTEGGASQRHKHLQVVPLPLAPDVNGVPLTQAFSFSEPLTEGIRYCPTLPFRHAIMPMPPRWQQKPDAAATELHRRYEALWRALGYPLNGTTQPVPYNLLATHDWVWLVPRSREKHRGIGVNALGFAGALMVKDETGLERLRECGPLRLLSAVGV